MSVRCALFAQWQWYDVKHGRAYRPMVTPEYPQGVRAPEGGVVRNAAETTADARQSVDDINKGKVLEDSEKQVVVDAVQHTPGSERTPCRNEGVEQGALVGVSLRVCGEVVPALPIAKAHRVPTVRRQRVRPDRPSRPGALAI